MFFENFLKNLTLAESRFEKLTLAGNLSRGGPVLTLVNTLPARYRRGCVFCVFFRVAA